MTTAWNIVYTQPRYEFKVDAQLTKLCIEHYLPVRKVLKQWSDRRKWVTLPAFPSYIFVRPDISKRNDVFYAKGVLHYLRSGDRDAVIRDSEMDMIRNADGHFTESPLMPLQLGKGQRVKIVTGPLAGHSGRLVESNGKRKIQLVLEDIEMGFLVEVPVHQVVAI